MELNKSKLLTIIIVIGAMIGAMFAFAKPVLKSNWKEFTIFHTNDTHAYVKEGKYAGMGFAKIKTIVEQERIRLDDGVLFLDGGDTFAGQTYATLTNGEAVIPVLNNVGYDAIALGNHEFDFGYPQLQKLIKLAKFPVLASNVLINGSNPFQKYQIFIKKGVKFGIFGLATPETAFKAHPTKVKGFSFTDPVVAAQAMVKKLREQEKVDVVIAVAHLGDDKNSLNQDGEKSENSRSGMVAQRAPGIDLIIDGHTHKRLDNGMRVGKTLIVQSGDKTKNLGQVKLYFNQSQKQVITKVLMITKADAVNVKPDSKVLALIAHEYKAIDKIRKEKIGINAAGLLERKNNGLKEMKLGNLIAQAMLNDSGADFALTNGGGIRAAMPDGLINKGHIIDILPFGNVIATIQLTGAEVITAIEHGISNYPNYKGAFPHLAGVTVTFDKNNKIINIAIQGKILDEKATYTLATNDFLAVGGDGYKVFVGKSTKLFNSLDEAVINLIKKEGTKAALLDGRLKQA